MSLLSKILLGGLVLLSAMGIAWLNDFTKPKRARTSTPGKGNPGTKVRTPAWLYVVLVAGFGVIFWSFAPRQPGPRRAAPENSRAGYVCLGVFVTGVLFLVAQIIIPVVRQYDRAVIRAFRRANEGDPDGAISELRSVIEEKGGSLNRANGLGTLLSLQEKWGEALEAYRAAEPFGGESNCVNRFNTGLALTKLGRAPDALPYLLRAVEITPFSAEIACLVCRILAENGYLDKARDVLRRIDEARKTTIHVSSSLRRKLAADVEECRALLAGVGPVVRDDHLGEF